MKMDSAELFSRIGGTTNLLDNFAEDEVLQDEEEDTGRPFSKSDTRKSNKPIMEKRRRARINSCLNDLKSILLEAMRKDPARHSKLEKADILELTVRHLQNIQRNQLAVAMATDPTVLYRFKNGFSECASEVSRYLCKLEGVDTGMKHRVSSHLTSCVNGLQGVNPVVGYPTAGGGGYNPVSRPPLADLPFSHHILPFKSGPSLPTTLLTPTQAEDDLNNNNNGLLVGEGRVVSAFTALPTPSGLEEGDEEGIERPPGGKRRLLDTPDPLDYSLAKDSSSKRVMHVARVVKVEPTIHRSPQASESSKDPMWRPW